MEGAVGKVCVSVLSLLPVCTWISLGDSIRSAEALANGESTFFTLRPGRVLKVLRTWRGFLILYAFSTECRNRA